MTVTADTTALQAWGDRLAELLEILKAPSKAVDALGPVPAGGTPGERLRVVRQLLHRLGWNPAFPDPCLQLWHQWHATQPSVAGVLPGLCHQLEEEVETLAALDDSDPPAVILTAALPERSAFIFHGDGEWTGARWVGVLAHALPLDHCLRVALPTPDDWYHKQYILLGVARPAGNQLKAKPWYDTDAALALTRAQAGEQRQAEAHERKLKELREAALREQEQRALAAQARQRARERAALAAQDRLIASELESNRECRQIRREAALVEMEIQRERAAKGKDDEPAESKRS